MRALARPAVAAALVAAWSAVLAASALLTLHPIVLGDETHYLMPTLFGASEENFARWHFVERIPNYLFHALYGLLPEARVYEAAKILNAILIGAAALPAYALARRYLPQAHACGFALLVALMPIGSFARYFMPEALYYPGFWCVAWLALDPRPARWWIPSLAAGAAAGVLALVKPHAAALAAAFALAMLLRPGPWRERVAAAACLAGAFYLVRLAAIAALGRGFEPSLAGSTYESVFSAAGLFAAPMLANALGHLAAIALLAGLPLAAVAWAAAGARRADDASRTLAIAACCVLAVLVAMTIHFSYGAFVRNPPAHSILRLHGRYYVYGLLLVVLAYAVLLQRDAVPRLLRSPAALAAWIAAAASAYVWLARLEVNILVDFPELGLTSRSLHGYAILAVGVAACALCVALLRARMPPGAWAGLLPLAWWGAVMAATSLSLAAMPLTGQRFAPDVYDRALVGHPLVDRVRGRDDGLIATIAPMHAEAMRVMFLLRSNARGLFLGPDMKLRAGDVPRGTRWLLLMPGIQYVGEGTREAVGPMTYVALP